MQSQDMQCGTVPQPPQLFVRVSTVLDLVLYGTADHFLDCCCFLLHEWDHHHCTTVSAVLILPLESLRSFYTQQLDRTTFQPRSHSSLSRSGRYVRCCVPDVLSWDDAVCCHREICGCVLVCFAESLLQYS